MECNRFSIFDFRLPIADLKSFQRGPSLKANAHAVQLWRAIHNVAHKMTHFLPSCFFAAATTWSGSNPNFLCNSLSGAEAPNVFIPTTYPEAPTYRSHPKVEACSTATRAFTFGGSTLSR